MPFSWSDLIPEELTRWWSAGAPGPRPVLPESSASGSNVAQFFSSSVKSREGKETVALWQESKRLWTQGPFGTNEGRQFVVDLVLDICEERGVAPSGPLSIALYSVIVGFLNMEGWTRELLDDEPSPNLTLEEAFEVRKLLRAQIALFRDHERLLPLVRHKLRVTLSGILGYFPPSAFVDIDENGQAMDDSIILPSAKALSLAEDMPTVIDRAILTFFDQDVTNAHCFDAMREQLDGNSKRASGYFDEADGKRVFPTEHKNQDPHFLVEAYLGGTPLYDFFHAGLPFSIPFPARFEHTHIIGGTGHGKTQLLQFLINHDLVRARGDNRSVIVMDSQGDLIRTISRLKYFSPDAEGSLSDRFVLIDPTDVEHPVALNMFDFNRSRLSGYAPLDREKVLNATVELYEYFFGALLGAELTQRQGLIFRYLARLLIEVPGATIHTLRELMEDGEKFLPHMEKLQGTARAFFATRFFDASFRETKKQILARLWGVLSNTALERMFSHKESKIDCFELMNSGKIVLINTAKDLLGQDGAAIFGRFFIALITQAAVQRSAIPAHKREPCFLYLDEAQEYFDTNIGNLLTQARKYKVGLVFAHQSMDQLGAELRASVLSNTTIKFAGGVSAKDASLLAAELRTEPDFLRAQVRKGATAQFACHVRNFTGKAISVSIPLGFVESLDQLSDDEMSELRERNREAYSAQPDSVPEVEFNLGPQRKESRPTPLPKTAAPVSPSKAEVPRPEVRTPPPTPPRPAPAPAPDAQPGKGGQEHKYLQHLIKRLAEERGFRAVIEESVLDGTGQVDVSLSRGKRRIACEISVTTSKDHELGNVEKCIAAGYKEIMVIGAKERQAKALARFIEENLEEGHGATIHATTPEALPDLLDSLGGTPAPRESTVRGYSVKTTHKLLSQDEHAERRRVLASVIAKGLGKGAQES
jgi:hypothetical protein